MNWPDIFLLCFGIGTLWSIATLLLGGLHLGHGAAGHGTGHAHAAHLGHVHGGHANLHSTLKSGGQRGSGGWLGAMVNPSSAAIFLAWFGGMGYILTRHSGLALAIDLVIALAMGLVGAWFLAAFLRFLQSKEKPLEPEDYEMVGVLGQVSCGIRPDGVGELIYVRDGARRPSPARSADGVEIQRGQEVVVTRYEKGIAYVRTWEAMTQPGAERLRSETLPKEINNVE